MKNLLIVVASLLMLGATSCGGGDIKLMPSITGKSGEVIVVVSKENWNGSIGQSLRATLGANYPAIPQDESLFTLLNVPEISFTKIFKTHRNIMMIEISPEHKEPQLTIKKDIWATPQVVLGLTAPDTASLSAYILANGDRMIHTLEQTERDRTVARAERYEDKTIREKLAGIFGGAPCVPDGYKIRKLTDDFAWVQSESAIQGKYMFQAIFMYKYPYKDSTDFLLDNIVKRRNEVLQREVPGAVEGSYMTTATAIEPMMRFIRYKDFHFAEVRGLWEVENDFQGGPFISHTFFDKDGKTLLCLEAIVYAPSFDKRNYIRQTEGIIYSFRWSDDTLVDKDTK